MAMATMLAMAIRPGCAWGVMPKAAPTPTAMSPPIASAMTSRPGLKPPGSLVTVGDRKASTPLPEARKAWALYREWDTRCSMARLYRPRPHSSSMKPICAVVDQASDTLMLVWVSITREARAKVVRPITDRVPRAISECDMIGLMRMIRKAPALTMPACSRADTGVGASTTWISQPWRGNCADLRTALRTISTDAHCRASGKGPFIAAMLWSKSAYSRLCRVEPIRKMAVRWLRSLMRLAMNFLCAASTAAGRSR